MPAAKSPRKRRTSRRGPVRPEPRYAELDPRRDYTGDIIEFLQEVHGDIRRDGKGDYYYGHVSTISLHFLLGSSLPAKEVLWQWYQHFDRDRSETIYQTLPPARDEEFLAMLERCAFRWDPETVKESGLVFLNQHRAEVYLALEEALGLRLDAFQTMPDAELRAELTPHGTWSDAHLAGIIRRIQTQPVSGDERQSLYDLMGSDYLRATARHLIDEATTEAFWKKPPPELEYLEARLIVFARAMRDQARRLGVFVSREAFEREARRFSRETYRRFTAGARAEEQRRSAWRANGARRERSAGHFAVLGLSPEATLIDVKAAYREQVKQHHPDQGGTVQDFLRLQEAYEYLLTEVV